MGLFSRLFAHVVADTIREDQKRKEQNKQWLATFDMLQAKENELTSYLSGVGCKLTYVFDSGAIDNGTVNAEIRKMEKIRKDVEEYIAIGGDIQILFHFEDLERRIGVLKYLRRIGQIHRQREFIDDNKYSVEDKIKAEQEALVQQTAALREEQKTTVQSSLSQIVGGDIDTLSGIDFEYVCQHLVENMGFKTETTKASGDGGIDIIAYNYQPLLSGKYVIQCKRYAGSVGEPIIRDLYGVVTSERANKGIVITTGRFTRSAELFAQGKPIELIDGNLLKQLLLQYGLINNKSGEDSSSVTSEKRFDPKAVMGYYYDDYITAMRAVDRDPGDIKNRCAAIALLEKTISMRMMLFELGDKGEYEVNYSDLHGMIDMLQKCIQPLIRQDNSRNPNKRLRFVYYTCMLVSAEYATLSGDFSTAVDIFSKALMEWEELKDNPVSQHIILNSLFAIFNFTNCPELTDKYCQKHQLLISEMRGLYGAHSDYEYQRKHNAAMMELINNPYSSTTIISFSGDDFYEKCVSDWGDFELSHGQLKYNVDSAQDCLMYFARNKWDKKEKDVIILEHLSKYADWERDSVRRAASKYIR